MSEITAQEFREAARTFANLDYHACQLLLAAAEQREELDRTVASLHDMRERKDQRIVELIQQVATLTAERDQARELTGAEALVIQQLNTLEEDTESGHIAADDLVLSVAHPEVRAAYQRLATRLGGFWYA